MTIYVSTDHVMISDQIPELRKFARLIGVVYERIKNDKCHLNSMEYNRAVKLGATPVTQEQIAAMYSLHLMGYDMGDPLTASRRRSDLARQYMRDDK